MNAHSHLTCLLFFAYDLPCGNRPSRRRHRRSGASLRKSTGRRHGTAGRPGDLRSGRIPGPLARLAGQTLGRKLLRRNVRQYVPEPQSVPAAPAQGERSEAVIRVTVPAAGRYLALVRYEAAYRFETQFRVVIEQNGRKVLDRLYGARNNLEDLAVLAETENGSRLGLGRVGKRRLGRPRGVR